MRHLLFAWLWLGALFCSPCGAVYVASGGIDGLACGATQDSPCASLGAASNSIAQPPDGPAVIVVAAGQYSGALNCGVVFTRSLVLTGTQGSIATVFNCSKPDGVFPVFRRGEPHTQHLLMIA
jgi:hypothetical protein